jgi:hypothetical protein
MHKPEHDENEDILADLGYEYRDLDMVSLSKATLWFAIFTTGGFAIGLLLFFMWNPQVKTEGNINRPFLGRTPPAPNPLLQTNTTTRTDIMELRQGETRRLTTAAVVDSKSGVYRIPIERAIALTAERGLPEKPDAQVVSGAR